MIIGTFLTRAGLVSSVHSFAKSDIGLVAKNAGLWPAVIGGLLGGLWMVRLGINRALWIFGVVQVLSILGFAFWQLAQVLR